VSEKRVGFTVEQLLRPTPGGIGTYTDQLRIAYSKRFGPLTLISSRGDRLALDSTSRQSPREHRIVQVSHAVTTRLWERGLRRPSLLANLDVLHATSFHFPDPGPHGPQLSVFVHDLAWKRYPEFFPERGRKFHERGLRRSIDLARWLLVPSEQTKRDLINLARVEPKRITVVGEGADHLPTPSANRTRTEPYLLTVSTQEPRKNLDGLLRAYEMLRRRVGPRCPRLLVVGPKGWVGDRDRSESGSKQRSEAFTGSLSGVAFVGAVSPHALADLYADALAFVYVPHFEGFGLPPLEAMFHGVAVLASDQVPSVTPVSGESGEPALVVSAGQPEAIAEALFQFVGDPELRARYAANGKQYAGSFTWHSVAARHHETWFSEVGL
jgi:glycosyltransferase involved in cell wall biosynthesis